MNILIKIITVLLSFLPNQVILNKCNHVPRLFACCTLSTPSSRRLVVMIDGAVDVAGVEGVDGKALQVVGEGRRRAVKAEIKIHELESL